MSVENFLKEAVDADAINYYLRLLAERQLQAEQMNMALTDCLQLSKQTSGKVEQQEEQIKQLKTQINSINTELNQLKPEKTQSNSISTELNQLKPRSKVIENTIGRFIVRSDGTATDTSTGLMWCRYAIGQQWYNGEVIGNANKMDWFSAMKIADCFNQQDAFGGFSDWRLPSLEELQSLVKTDKSPSINDTVFPNTPREMFWSSSTPMININTHMMIDTNNLASFVYFSSGNSNIGNTTKYQTCAVRLVR